jgi:hypothetical protein
MMDSAVVVRRSVPVMQVAILESDAGSLGITLSALSRKWVRGVAAVADIM